MFCKNCGTQIPDEAVFCANCGTTTQDVNQQQNFNYQQQAFQPAVRQPSGLATAAKILMIITTVLSGIYILPLAWCIPMTMHYSNCLKTGKPASTGFKVCVLLFVNTLSGILMLCDKDH